MDWSFIDTASIIGTAPVSTATIAMVLGFAAFMGLRIRFLACTIAVAAAFAVLIGSKMLGVSTAPFIRAEMHDYDADLEKMPVVTKMIDRHPELRQRLTNILKTATRQIVDLETAGYAAEETLKAYVAPYFARTTSIAMHAFLNSWQHELTHYHSVDPVACQDFLFGHEATPVPLMRMSLLDRRPVEIEQVISHAIAQPQDPPSQEWFEQRLISVFGKSAQPVPPFVTDTEVTCLAFLQMLRAAEKRMNPRDYLKFMRGIISVALHEDVLRTLPTRSAQHTPNLAPKDS